MFEVLEAQFNWYVPPGFTLDRLDGLFPHWIIAQYFNPVDLEVDGKTLSATPGDLVLIPPHTPHKYSCAQPLHHHWIHLSGDVASIMQGYDLAPNRLYPTRNADELSSLFRSASLTYHGNDPYKREYLRLKAEEIIIRTAIEAHMPSIVREISGGHQQTLEGLRSKILEHPENDWNVPYMAASLYMSTAYFYTIYQQRFGISPAQDVQSIRMERARAMLQDGVPVSQTAEHCGYKSVYHFIRQFKRIHGITPGRYGRGIGTAPKKQENAE